MVKFLPLEMWIVISVITCFVLLFVGMNFKFNEKSTNSNESFECGMEPMISNRIPFSMQFYLISILFLIFDIELIITIPLVFSFLSVKEWVVLVTLIMLMLTFGLIMEIILGTLEWKSFLTNFHKVKV